MTARKSKTINMLDSKDSKETIYMNHGINNLCTISKNIDNNDRLDYKESNKEVYITDNINISKETRINKILPEDVSILNENLNLVKKIDFSKNCKNDSQHFNVLKSINERSYISEVTIPIYINDIKFMALCDSGSESSIIGLNYINKYFPNWHDFNDGINKPSFGIGVDGSKFNILAVKEFKIQIGTTIRLTQLSIPEKSQELILGLDLLKIFKISMYFYKPIQIYCNKVLIPSAYIYDVNVYNVIMNEDKCTLYPKQQKMYSVKNDILKNDITYLSFSDENCNSIIIPSIAVAQNNTINIIINNDSTKKVVFKPKTFNIKIMEVDSNDIFPVNSEEGRQLILDSKTCPLPFYNKCCRFNQKYYNRNKEYITRLSFLNNVFDSSLTSESTTLEKLADLPGISLPKLHFPIKSPSEIVEESLNYKKHTQEEKDFLIHEFTKFPKLVSQFSYDVGQIKDIHGKPILMNIPLNGPLPKMTKSYKLSKEENSSLNDILDFLIYYNLAENSDVSNMTGSPCFLVSRPDSSRAHRLIIDTRKVNSYIKSPVSTFSDSVTEPLKDILSKYTYLTKVDLANAYYSLRCDEETLNSNITQVYTPDRCVRFLAPITGLANIPSWWSNTIGTQMNICDKGLFDPLTTNTTYFNFWIDDFIIGSVGTLQKHMIDVDKFLYRLNRLGLKINFQKSEFFLKVKEDNFSLLGYEVEKGKIIPNKNKLNILKEFKSPTSVTEVQKFLGYLTFIRHLIPLKVIDLMSVLNPLTSNKNPFKWKEHHNEAFEKIKEILHADLNYAEPMSEESIKIIYSDASESLLGAILFSYDCSHFSQDPPDYLSLTIPNAFKNHITSYKIACRTVISVNHSSKFVEFIHILTNAQNFHELYDYSKHNISFFLNGIFGFILKIRRLFNSSKSLNDFLEVIFFKEITDEFFFEHFDYFLAIAGIVFKCNIKLIFGNYKTQKQPYFCSIDGYKTDILLGFETSNQKFTLFYILELFEKENFKLETNNKMRIDKIDPKKILDEFKKTLENNDARKHIKLVSQFSKAIPEKELHHAIYLKESCALLYALDSFKNDIKNDITLICTDSRTSFFMFNPETQNSSKKLIRWSLKISLSYKNVHILNISGKENIADFLSRLGLPKTVFFTRSLTPLCINHEVRKKLPEFLTWSSIMDFCNKHPELIKFSEKKIDVKIQNQYFLDILSPDVKNDSFKSNTLKLFMEQKNLLDKFLTREELIKHQSKISFPTKAIELNGLMFIDDKCVLPQSLYVFAVLREHFIGLHQGISALISSCKNLFYIENKNMLKSVAEKTCKSCLACILVKSQMDKQKHGIFPVKKSNLMVFMDFIEGLPGRNAFLLVFVDLYSRFISTFVLKDKKTNSVLNCIRSYLSTNGVIKYLICDNYSGFRSKEFVKFMNTHSIIQPVSSPYRSRARSIVEIYNQIIQRGLKMLTLHDRENWQDLIPIVTFITNNRRFYSEKLSASQLHYGIKFLRHDFLRPEQSELFKSIIPPKFWEESDKYHDIIDKIEDEFNMKRMEKLKKRQNRTNKYKKDTMLEKGDFCVIKKYSETIGVSRKLRETFEFLPFKVLLVKEFYSVLENLIDGSQTLRSNNDIKKIELFESEPSKIQKIIFEKLNILTAENILTLFNNKRDENSIEKVQTRAMTEIEREKNSIMDNYLFEEDDVWGEDVKTVRFDL